MCGIQMLATDFSAKGELLRLIQVVLAYQVFHTPHKFIFVHLLRLYSTSAEGL